MSLATSLIRTALVAGTGLIAASPAFAGAPATPAPLLGAGLPVLAAFGAGYWALRRRRGR